MKRLRQAGAVWSRPEGTRCYVSLRPDLERRFPGLLATILAAEGDAHEVRPGHADPGPQAGADHHAVLAPHR